MYWAITLLWFFLGLAIAWISLTLKWNNIDPMYRGMFRTFMIFNPIPGHDNYTDLKFSVLRHSLAFLISSVPIYFLPDSRFILRVILFLNLIYAFFSVNRYHFRKKHLAETRKDPESEATAKIISIPIQDSFVTVLHAVICSALLYVLYGIRP